MQAKPFDGSFFCVYYKYIRIFFCSVLLEIFGTSSSMIIIIIIVKRNVPPRPYLVNPGGLRDVLPPIGRLKLIYIADYTAYIAI